MDELGRVPLRALVALARLGTMTAVVAELGYTPGAVSQQIARLETAVSVPLLTRIGRGVRLTDAGRVLAEHGAAVLQAEDAALQAMRAALTSVTGRLTIGMFGSTAGAVLAPLVINLRERHPAFDIRSQEVTVDHSAAAVRRGLVDVAFGVDYSSAPIPRDPDVDSPAFERRSFRSLVRRHSPSGAPSPWPTRRRCRGSSPQPVRSSVPLSVTPADRPVRAFGGAPGHRHRIVPGSGRSRTWHPSGHAPHAAARQVDQSDGGMQSPEVEVGRRPTVTDGQSRSVSISSFST